MPKINREEYEVLKGLDERAKSIVRQEGGCLWVAEQPIMKDDSGWYVYDGFDVELKDDSLFHFIQWEDENPYNIAELIEEYEKYKKVSDYFKVNIKNVNQSMLDDLPTESEETEVKNIEWLKKELNTIKEEAQEILDEYDNRGPIVYRFEERLHSVNVFRNLLDQLDEPEVLSQEWIEEHTWNNHYIGRPFVYVDDLQNLLVSKQELPVVPTWFDKWWKDVYKGEGNLLRNIDMFHDKLYSYGTREMYNYISTPDNKKKLLNIIINELDYVVEKEQKLTARAVIEKHIELLKKQEEAVNLKPYYDLLERVKNE